MTMETLRSAINSRVGLLLIGLLLTGLNAGGLLLIRSIARDEGDKVLANIEQHYLSRERWDEHMSLQDNIHTHAERNRELLQQNRERLARLEALLLERND